MNFQHARKSLHVGSIIEALLHTQAVQYRVNIKFSKSNAFLIKKNFGQPGGSAHQG